MLSVQETVGELILLEKHFNHLFELERAQNNWTRSRTFHEVMSMIQRTREKISGEVDDRGRVPGPAKPAQARIATPQGSVRPPPQRDGKDSKTAKPKQSKPKPAAKSAKPATKKPKSSSKR